MSNTPRNIAFEIPNIAELRRKVVECSTCPRLVSYCRNIARVKKREFNNWEYWGRPVPGFGDVNARLMIIGLAPAAHGGNRTGRVFTGDRSGDFLFKCLYQTGFANQPISKNRRDGLRLKAAYITASVKCAPPDNKPTLDETIACSKYLSREIDLFPDLKAFLCLGQFAYQSLLRVLHYKYKMTIPQRKFGHGIVFELGPNLPNIYTSYHPSPRNTQTGALTERMMVKVLNRINNKISNN